MRDYFNQINLIKIGEFLESKGVPVKVSDWIVQTHRSLAILPTNSKFKEDHIETVKSEQYFNSITANLSVGYTEDFISPESYKGVPQGSNTGPLLSLIPLLEFLKQKPSVSYADDGLFYSDKPFEIQDLPQLGVHLNASKSGWVRYNGKWLKPLKFLGLVFNGTSL